jgi:outer membrane autotransporter protein
MPESFNSGTIVLCEDCGKIGNDPTAAAGRITVTDSTLATYTKVVNGQQIDITAVKKSAATIASALGVTEEAATALDNASTAVASDAALATILNATLSAGGDAATELTKQVQGSPAGISATSGAATASAGAAVVSVGSSRMASLRTGNAYASTFGSGFSAGNLSQSNSLWMKPFASFGDQGERKSIAGYDADTYGIAIGGDRRINAKSIVGLSFSFADTDVDGKGAGRSHSDISSYQLTAYGDYTTKNYYVEALVGYAYNDIDTTRDITATNTKAKGTTESDQFMINVSAGRPMKMAGAAYFTPSVGLNLTHVVNSAYTETGAGALNLRVDAEDITIAKAFLGGRYHANIKNSEGTFTPELRAKLLYDMAGDDGSSSSTFTGGGAAFNVKGLDVVEFATSVGFGLGYTPDFDQGVNLSLNYDAELKENFTGHSANFTLKYAF